jgi:hypothetical protein
MKTTTVVLFLGLMILSGCETISVKSKLVDDEDSTGLVYATAINAMSVEVKYVIKEKRKLMYGVEMKQNAVPEVVAVQACVKSELLPDPYNVFVVDAEKVADSWFFDANIKYDVSENGLLLAANTELTDKTREVVKEVVETTLTVAKAVATIKGETKLPDDVKPLEERIKAIYGELKDANITKEHRAQLMQEMKDLYTYIAFYMENNKEEWVLSEQKSVSFSVPYDFFDFNDVKGKKGEVVYYEKKYELKGLVSNVTIYPEVFLRLYISPKEHQNAGRIYNGTADGFVYRVPRTVRAQVVIKNLDGKEFCSYDEYVRIPQLSSFYTVPCRSKTWTNRKSDLKFSPNNGSLISLGSSAGSSAEGASKVAQETISKIDSKLGDIRDASRNYEKAVLESKKELLNAEREYLQARKELSDYRKQMEGAGASQSGP